MVICECILSNHTLEHLETVQKILQNDSSVSESSGAIELLLRYILSDVDGISVNDLVLIDDYFSEHPSFLRAFYNDVMMSANLYSDSYGE
ncbi:MAG: hypothetical protein ACE5DT_03210 [Nitrosopumilus sp.]